MTPGGIDHWLQAASLIAATCVSEDATCIGTGLLVRAGQFNWAVGLGACTAGIFLGDLGLWLVGRVFGRRALEWSWVRRRLPETRVDEWGQWFDRRGMSAVLAARFLPGTRLPVYIAAGMLGRRAGRFALWAFLAALLWTPLLILLVASLGNAVVTPMQRVLGAGWAPIAATLVVLWLTMRILQQCMSRIGRAKILACVSRLWRWEFWPAWIFYIPLIPWIAYLAVRYRGLMTLTAANPGIVPHGGIVGESKFDILSRLPAEWIIPSALIKPGPLELRVAQLTQTIAERGWQFPLILKPDAGQRGAGVRRAQDIDATTRYFEAHPQAVLVQTYHPGPFEAGVFYYRMPGEARGRIFSITDKQFPVLIGDGVSTVESLIWRHPRFRMQAATFLARRNGQAETVLQLNEPLPLTITGNHCQGALFRDGAHLMTQELEDAIDAIARRFDGFYFGRFDVRYNDVNEFRAGRGFAIVELNGVTSESTNLYDPSWSLIHAYSVLFRQWSMLFKIGNRNRRRGQQSSSLVQVIADARCFYRRRKDRLVAD
ncbi:MAG: VTT domain-containing protein [Planctomycetes bacterium]|nr:VTT domain-containing protein [Planctomycetota bacterium]